MPAIQTRFTVLLRRLAMGVLALGVLPSSSAAQANSEIHLGGETGGSYRLQLMSWAEIPFRSVVRQQYDFSCGSAAVATLLTYHYGNPTPEREAFAEMWRVGDQQAIQQVGFSMFDMKSYLESLGYRADGYRMNVEDIRRIARPMIVLLDIGGFKHFVVVKGLTDDRILVGDPALGLTDYDVSEFEGMWNNIALVITDTLQTQPAFNLASDWGPWSTAPVSEGIDRQPAGTLTTHLPTAHQLIPQFLLTFPAGD